MSLITLDRPIAFHRVFVRITGSVTAALMLSQAVYWQRRSTCDGEWFYKTEGDWEEETGITPDQQRTARKALETCGVLEVVRKGVPARLYYRLNEAKLDALLAEIDASSSSAKTHNWSSKNQGQVDGKTQDKSGEKQTTITETTTETTHTSSLRSEENTRKGTSAKKLPDNFALSDDMASYATERLLNPQEQFESFVDWHRARGSRMADWSAAWRTWIRKAVDFAERSNARAGRPYQQSGQARPMPNAKDLRAGNDEFLQRTGMKQP